MKYNSNIPFDKVLVGEYFLFEGKKYLKISNHSGGNNAFNLDGNYLFTFRPKDKVDLFNEKIS